MKPGARTALAVLLVAAAGPAGFLTYRFLAAEHLIAPPGATARLDATLQSSMSRPAGSATVGAASAPAAGAGAIPEALPELTLPDMQGTPRKLSAWRGHPMLINFWATWCAPCRREIPLLERLRRNAADGLAVIGIAVDDRDPVLKYAHAMAIDYPVLVGGTDAGMAAVGRFGMQAVLPFSVFVDARGRIVAVKVGELHPDDARLILSRLDEVDAGHLPLQSARDQISSGLASLAAARAKG